jgi:hypothetical protein
MDELLREPDTCVPLRTERDIHSLFQAQAQSLLLGCPAFRGRAFLERARPTAARRQRQDEK